MASVTIWNMCRSEIESTRVFLRQKKTVFDSANAGPLRRYLVALAHQDTCRPFRVVLVRTNDGCHVLKVLPQGCIRVSIGSKAPLSEEALTKGVKLSHGNFVRVYYKLRDENRMAGPFAFEYLAEDQLEAENDQAGVDHDPLDEKNPGKQQPPLNLLQLPEEVIRRILSAVPSCDLFYRVSPVCQDLNKIVGSGVPFEHFGIENFTVEETAALTRMIESAPPISTAIGGIWFDDNDQPIDQLLVFCLTREAQVLKLDVSGRVSNREAVPKLQLTRLLPNACIRRLKYLELTGCLELEVQNGCCFEELEQLWVHSGTGRPGDSAHKKYMRNKFDSAALLGPQGKLIFPKVSSLCLVGRDSSETSFTDLQQWSLDRRDCPFERVQMYGEGFTPRMLEVASRMAKTLKVQLTEISMRGYCELLPKLLTLENLAVFSFTAANAKRCLESAPPSIKILQLIVPQLRVKHLEIIFERFSDLEFLCVRFKKLDDQIDEAWLEEFAENSSFLKGIALQQETEERTVMMNDLVGGSWAKTEDFWVKKIRRVFGPVDHFVGYDLVLDFTRRYGFHGPSLASIRFLC